MDTIRCGNCQHENPPDFSTCSKCGANMRENNETENENISKAKPLMHDKQISDETQKLRDDTLPKTDDEWQEALERHKTEQAAKAPKSESDIPTPVVNLGDLLAGELPTPINLKNDNTVEAKAIDSDAVLQFQAEEERRKTEELPDIDDEDSVLRIGAVRFKGDLVLKHQDTATDFTIKNNNLQEVVIGRLDRVTGFAPTVDLTEVGGKVKGVSRRHATISIRGDLLVITDHNSMNGTFLNGQRLVPEQARVLRDTDVLRIGRVSLLIHFKNY
jgi:hypothetical protein